MEERVSNEAKTNVKLITKPQTHPTYYHPGIFSILQQC